MKAVKELSYKNSCEKTNGHPCLIYVNYIRTLGTVCLGLKKEMPGFRRSPKLSRESGPVIQNQGCGSALYPDPDPAFFLIADPDPVLNPVF
jgi:hypothetical protein